MRILRVQNGPQPAAVLNPVTSSICESAKFYWDFPDAFVGPVVGQGSCPMSSGERLTSPAIEWEISDWMNDPRNGDSLGEYPDGWPYNLNDHNISPHHETVTFLSGIYAFNMDVVVQGDASVDSIPFNQPYGYMRLAHEFGSDATNSLEIAPMVRTFQTRFDNAGGKISVHGIFFSNPSSQIYTNFSLGLTVCLLDGLTSSFDLEAMLNVTRVSAQAPASATP